MKNATISTIKKKNSLEEEIFAFIEGINSGDIKIDNKDSFRKNKWKNILNILKDLNFLLEEKKEFSTLLEYSENKEEKNDIVAELELNKIKINKVLFDFKYSLLTEKGIEDNKVIIEIRPGAGGTESGLFIRDLFRMYSKWAYNKKFEIKILEERVDEKCNFSFLSFLISGKSVYYLLKNEAGVHRVQRVPITENKGRVHTSTVSVVVLPEPSEDNESFQLNNSDLRIETYGAGGPGGQHVNKTESAIRITHLPTGIVATSQESRDQRINRERAKLVIRARILEKKQSELLQNINKQRTDAIGDSNRSEKIRTYNWIQNRVTDHRIEENFNNLFEILEGRCDYIFNKLLDLTVLKSIESYKNECI